MLVILYDYNALVKNWTPRSTEPVAQRRNIGAATPVLARTRQADAKSTIMTLNGERTQTMKRPLGWVAARILLAAGLALTQSVHADFEVTAPDGRRITVFDNGTWRYAGIKEKDAAVTKADDKDKPLAVLTLVRKTERGTNCRFALRLVNNYPYEIRSLIPYYAAYREDGVIYDTVSAASGFTSMKPGDEQGREIEFVNITCQKIARVQVTGGDRCEMGDLYKFSEKKGECLARVRVVASDLVRFDK